MTRFGYKSSERRPSELPPPPPSMCVDPRQVPTELMEPSMEAGQSASPAATSGWSCPRCGIVWGPRVKRCTCEPPESADTRTEIHEAAPHGMSYNDVRREARMPPLT